MTSFDPELLQLAARLEAATGRDAEAVRALRAYLHDDNANWIEGWMLLAESERRLGHDAQAAAATENADRTARNQAILLHRQARAAAWHGDDERSAQLLDMALMLAPDDAAARAERAALGTAADRP
jgi:tetratricopeptide (TPR) repeat protein